MAGPIDSPVTPPRTSFKSTDGLVPGRESPRHLREKSPADSGIADVFDDAATTTTDSSRPPSVTVEPDVSKSPSSRKEPENIMPEDPFDSQHNRILFDAIDALQSFGAGELNIPQVSLLSSVNMSLLANIS